MKYLVTFSGGKDSLSTIIWAKKNLPYDKTDVVLCDTGWESDKTYKHIEEVEEYWGKGIIRLMNNDFKGLIDLFIKKKRAASTKARFCTEYLKVRITIDFILKQSEDLTIIQGVRSEESESRRNLNQSDEYFKFYEQPYGYSKKGSPKYHTYRKKEVLNFISIHSVDVYRPILKWTAKDVFNYIFENGLKPNPLYYEGFSRVGCFPCIMARHEEIRIIARNYKDRITQIRDFEEKSGKTFFPPGYIPKSYCSKKVIDKKGNTIHVPTIDDVVNYLIGNDNQSSFFDPPSCISPYSICE